MLRLAAGRRGPRTAASRMFTHRLTHGKALATVRRLRCTPRTVDLNGGAECATDMEQLDHRAADL